MCACARVHVCMCACVHVCMCVGVLGCLCARVRSILHSLSCGTGFASPPLALLPCQSTLSCVKTKNLTVENSGQTHFYRMSLSSVQNVDAEPEKQNGKHNSPSCQCNVWQQMMIWILCGP